MLGVAEDTVSRLSSLMYFHLSTASGLTQPCVMCEDTEFTRECPWFLFLLSVAQITNLLQIPVKEWTSLVLK